MLSVSGEGATPGNFADFDYYHGVGRGGQVNLDGNGGEGGAGAALIIASVPGTPLPSQTTMFYTGKGPQSAVNPVFRSRDPRLAPGE